MNSASCWSSWGGSSPTRRPAILLGVDIGGTKVALRAEAPDGRAHETTFTWPAAGTHAADLAALRTHAEAVTAGAGRAPTAVGVAVPATVDGDGRVTAWPTRPHWTGLDLAAALHGIFPAAEVCWADDADLAALAEARAADCADLVYAGVGTGIGGGIVLDGRMLPGPGRGSCELGHLIVDRDGVLCDCGRRGCVQAEASGPATLRRAAAARGAQVAFADLRDGFAEGAAWAVGAVDAGCDALAAALVGVAELVRPTALVVGGGFATGIPGYVERVAAHAARLARPGHPVAPVRPALLGGRSSLYGAVLAARDGLGGVRQRRR
ncbi:ROK family protein [Streptomyces sp. NPDC057623]|uniref:ROK family protein n=1 Tax=Streptomyces sp. NPDC057623 TaxID=3346187 RepID=UPI0036BDACD1